MNRPTTPTEAPGSGRRILYRPAALALLAVLVLGLPSPSEAVRRRAFVTSVTGTGALSTWPDSGGHSGLVGGDAICRARAAAAGLPGAASYRAWLSDATTDAYCHVQGLTGTRAAGCAGGAPDPCGPWYRSDGVTVFAGSLDELTGPQRVIYRAVHDDEFGAPVSSNGRIWTGTDDEGIGRVDRNCFNWGSLSAQELGLFGQANTTAQVWTYNSSTPCSSTLALLCLEPGVSEAPDLGWPGPGSIVFVTRARGNGDLSSWPIAGEASGLAAGDAICRNSAAAAHLPAPESFVAWLSDITVDARDRLTSNGPFRRPDGVEVAASEAYLENGWNPESIHQHEDGGYQADEGGGVAHTGTDSAGLDTGHDCLGWSFPLPAQTGTTGTESSIESETWTDAHETGCHISSHLYCFSNATILFWDGFDLTGDTSRWSSVAP